MRPLRTLGREELSGKTALVRINLDIKNPRPESLRIRAALPTLCHLLKNDAKPIVMSHRGRPHVPDPSLSLEPAVRIISEILKTDIGWLENLRFDQREEKNNAEFAKELAEKGDIYVNDDFATSHRTCASLVAITEFLPSYAGLNLEQEIKNLSKARDNPELPFVVILGGIKISDKLSTMDALKRHGAEFLLGSAYTLPPEALPRDMNIVMPRDFVSDNGENLDIGPETRTEYAHLISAAKTVIWSGPMGKAEDARYGAGSRAVAEAIKSNSEAFSIAGGGDTADFLAEVHMQDAVRFISTGGGAMLAFLAGDRMPGIEALGED